MTSNGGEAKTYEIPKECKAGVVVNEGPDFRVEVQMVPVPEPGPDEVLLKLNATGLCMSDIHFMIGDWGLTMNSNNVRCAGHEGAGIVVKLGANVKDWKLGDRGGLKPLFDVCHNCEQCWNGRENFCQDAIYTGYQATGSYQQYVVSPAKYTSRIPDGVSDYVAAPIMCSASTMHRALLDCGAKPGQFIAFPGGGGGVGIQGVQLAKAMGFRPIVVDGGAKKKDLAEKMGADTFIDFTTSEDVAGDVVKAAGGVGCHCVIVTAYQAYKDAISYIGNRIGGRIVCVALPPAGLITVGADPLQYVFKNLTISGSLVGTMQDTAAALDYAARGLLKPICEVRGMSQFPESVQELRRGEVAGRIVIDFNKE